MSGYILREIQNNHFDSKAEMATALGVHYRTLLRVFSSECSRRDMEIVMDSIIRYSIVHDVPLNHFLDDLYD